MYPALFSREDPSIRVNLSDLLLLRGRVRDCRSSAFDFVSRLAMKLTPPLPLNPSETETETGTETESTVGGSFRARGWVGGIRNSEFRIPN